MTLCKLRIVIISFVKFQVNLQRAYNKQKCCIELQ